MPSVVVKSLSCGIGTRTLNVKISVLSSPRTQVININGHPSFKGILENATKRARRSFADKRTVRENYELGSRPDDGTQRASASHVWRRQQPASARRHLEIIGIPCRPHANDGTRSQFKRVPSWIQAGRSSHACRAKAHWTPANGMLVKRRDLGGMVVVSSPPVGPSPCEGVRRPR